MPNYYSLLAESLISHILQKYDNKHFFKFIIIATFVEGAN